MVLLEAIMDALGEAYPPEFAAGDPLSGLLVGSHQSPVNRVLCSLEISSELVSRAAADRFELLVVHDAHLLGGAPLTAQTHAGRICTTAARAGMNVVACGLNAEVAEGGTADLMARR
ncbi:MAG: Nif3-like dinuclear metal center hexameric protein, partial [Candidatus Geothermincolia bacterium]